MDDVSFGPFQVLVNERLLTREGVPVELGARALDLLITLISTPHEVVSKQDLLARVWPDVIVEESSLRFHMNALRKALGDSRDGARYITTLPGRGYCFVAPVSRLGARPEDTSAPQGAPLHTYLLKRLTRMIGRAEDVLSLAAQFTVSRLVTVVGAGWIAKTTVVVAVGHHLNPPFDGAVLFIEFGMLTDVKLVVPGIASMLGMSINSDDMQPSLMAYLREKRI